MKLLFRQRLFSWFDSYDIFDESETTVYKVKGQMSWGHCLKIFRPDGREEGMVKQKVLAMFPTFELYEGDRHMGHVRREFSPFKPSYEIDFNGWHVEGSFLEWDYTITGANGERIATISKELFHMTDTYVMDIADPKDALYVLMFVLAIDAEKCSRK